ncbi:MAG: sensor histidine kinase [Flavobacteriia bacterium]|nr:sensor histidine kinase [Flavobacteriia bacterium]OJX35136.1 MAG: hypothetical protein BGO87_08225 [Flavobacteriia bacterium 40-80]
MINKLKLADLNRILFQSEGGRINPYEKKHLLAGVNLMLLLFVPYQLINSFFILVNGFYLIGSLMAAFTLIQLLAIPFKKYNNLMFANTIILLFSGVNLSLYLILFNFSSHTYLFAIPLLMSVVFLYPYSCYKHIIASIISILLFICISIYLSVSYPSLISNYKYPYFFSGYNDVVPVVLLMLITIYFGKTRYVLSKKLSQIQEENKEQQQKLKETIEDKNVLLSEIHHRTKNNLSIVYSMINIQRHSVDDPKLKQILLDSANRIHSMKVVHQKLYDKEEFLNVNLREYVYELVSELTRTFFENENDIHISFDVDEIYLFSSQAIPCSLIINEVLTNSIKYAFPSGKGKIAIKIKGLGSQILVQISDNGIGFDIQNRSKSSLGMVLVEALSNQLNGTYEYSINNGTTFALTFKYSTEEV